jgi:hypothetical protein
VQVGIALGVVAGVSLCAGLALLLAIRMQPEEGSEAGSKAGAAGATEAAEAGEAGSRRVRMAIAERARSIKMNANPLLLARQAAGQGQQPVGMAAAALKRGGWGGDSTLLVGGAEGAAAALPLQLPPMHSHAPTRVQLMLQQRAAYAPAARGSSRGSRAGSREWGEG